MHCRLCISISGLYLLDAGYKPPPQCDNPKCLQTLQMSLEVGMGELPLIEKH